MSDKRSYDAQGASTKRDAYTKIGISLTIGSIMWLIALVFPFTLQFTGLSSPNTDTLKQDAQKAISNGAGLDVIDSMTSEHSVSTAELLDELRVDLFTSDSVDKDLIDRVGVLIDENEESDPFNVLNEEQKYLFENIRIKSGENYPEIENDVNRIVTSLKERNDLVTRYLAASESSARLAWFAAILAIISVAPILVSMFAFASDSIQSFYRWIRGKFTRADEDADDSDELSGTDESTESY